MRSKNFADRLKETSMFKTHEGKVEHLLYVSSAILISILEELEKQNSTRESGK